MSNINLKQLEVFAAIADCGSFTEAANRLYLAQSTVSSHVRALEECLGCTLLKRETKKRVELTESGKRVYKYAKEIISKCEELETGVMAEIGRNIAIGASTLPSRSIVPEIVSAFLKKWPVYTCDIKNGDSEKVHDMLQEGEIQIGFVGASDKRQMFVYEKIAEDHLVMITPNTPKYAALKADGALGRDILGEPMILRENGSGTQKMVDNYLSGVRLPAGGLNVIARVSSPDMLSQMVINGLGTSILSDFTVSEYAREGKVLEFELEPEPIIRNIYMVHLEKSLMSEAAKTFMAFVREKTR